MTISVTRQRAENASLLQYASNNRDDGFFFFQLHQRPATSTWWCSPLPKWGWVEMAGQIYRGARPKGRPHCLGLFFCWAAR